MNKYKIITLILIIVIIAGIAVMCSMNDKSKEDELGKIKTPSTKGTQTVQSKSIFKPVDNKFGYSMKEYLNPRAKMNIAFPSSWEVDWDTDRTVNVLSPKEDKFFPDTSFLVRYDFGLNEITNAREMIDNFKNELFKSYYTVDGVSYKVFDYKDPSISTDTKYTNGHDNLVACAETKNIKIKSSNLDSSKDNYTKLDYYINWNHIPCVISCIVDNKKAKDAKEILKLIASNVKYSKQDIVKTGKTASLNNEFDLQLKLPHQFKPINIEDTASDNYLVYRAPENNQSVFSGMSVMMFEYEPETEFTNENIMKEFGREWFSYCFGDTSALRPTFYCEDDDKGYVINNKEAISYNADYSIIASAKNYYKYLIPGETWKMKVFVLYGENSNEVIVINYQESQEKEMKKIIKLFAK